MAKVKCRYCGKKIDRDTAFSPLARRYYCNAEEYNKRELEALKKSAFMNKYIATHGMTWDDVSKNDLELCNSLGINLTSETEFYDS